ncbi:transferase [Pseudonocardia sp. CA-107938]|uniref:transferase n=1 Tax=Pseudonocardia sp. CA-107938 TaxID=3240021 RepID=UPI003D94E682
MAAVTRGAVVCRYCRSTEGKHVLDLGLQPASECFPIVTDPGPDPMSPLRLWWCAGCGLAQLADDTDLPERPEGDEPDALVRQRRDAVAELRAAGLLRAGATVAEGATPHGGTWLPNLTELGLRPIAEGERAADVFVDGVFGMMHAVDQAAALDASLARLAPDGLLLLQFHSLAAIVGHEQWNAVRHGHYAYYSTPVIQRMLRDRGLTLTHAWTFPLYGGTVLVAARRGAAAAVDASVERTISAEVAAGVLDPDALAGLQHAVDRSTSTLGHLLDTSSAEGRVVYGYSAASRAVALLHLTGVSKRRLPAVADSSPGKHGCRMPGTDVPVVSPAELVAAAPELVILFVPDLLAEVRRALPEVERQGGRWIDPGVIRLPSSRVTP